MLFNYIKTTFRAIWKAPVYGFLNITGLALGIACAALIFLWVEDELHFDRTAAKRNTLYLVRMNIGYSGKIESYTTLPGPMPAAMRGTITGITNLSRFGFGRELFGLKDKSTYENGSYVDTSYFSMLQLHFIKGSAAGFDQLHSLVLTETMAKKFFGDADPTGKTLLVNNQHEYKITGVVNDAPQNSSMHFNWLAPVDNFIQRNQWLNNWGTYGINTLVELQPGTDIRRVNEQLTAMLRPHDKQYANANCRLWSMNDWHLRANFTNGEQDGGQIRYVRLFSAIAWIILIIACINFMNLATARAGKRAKEIGVRKAIGAVKRALIFQFIVEALIMAFLAVLLAVLLIYLLLPGFNILVNKQLVLDLFAPAHFISLLAIGIFCGLVAGSYPAFYLSSFKPTAVLKGQSTGQSTGAGFIRKGLVVLQFTVSIVLIVCTVIIYQQVQHIKNRDLGYSKQNMLSIETRGEMVNHFNVIKEELIRSGAVESAALTASPSLAMWSTETSDQMTWQGNDPNNKVRINWESVSPEYIGTMGLKLLDGRDFHPDIKSDSGNIIINEELARLMGKQGHVGALITFRGRLNFRIIAIVKNYLFNDMYASVAPLMLSCDRETADNYGNMIIRLKQGQPVSAALSKIETIVKTNNPGYPFDYVFVDEAFGQLFRMETQIGNLASVFAILAIFISCLGLFGLAAYTAERRTKEIGVRKVLGATTAALVTLLSKEFLQLVAISCVIAFPLAWWAMNNWLADYNYRIAIQWWVFLTAGIGALLIALLTVSVQAVKAALANPVKSLRSE